MSAIVTKTQTGSFRWGFLGVGEQASRFAQDLSNIPGAEVALVASRHFENAKRFASSFDGSHAVETYEELVGSDVDAIYVSTPHVVHSSHVALCIEAEKPVICEKPLAASRSASDALAKLANERGVFLMEAMWMKFIPAIHRFQKLAAEGLIGTPRMLKADFSFRTLFNPNSRFFDSKQAGGGLLEVGVYPLHLAYSLFGSPVEISGVAEIGTGDVDEQCAITLRFGGGEIAVLTAATRTHVPFEARLFGTAGSLELPSPFYCSDSIVHYPGADPDRQETLVEGSKFDRFKNKICSRLKHPKGWLAPRTISVPFQGNGLHYQAEAAMECIQEGLLSCSIHPMSATSSVLDISDRLREQWGVKFPSNA